MQNFPERYNQVDCSNSVCHPFRSKKQSGEMTCVLCGVSSSVSMEFHVFADLGRCEICPLCHASQHLDAAGDFKSGVMIWLPEMTQPALNSLVTTIFSSLILGTKGGVPEEDVGRMKTLYRTLESRSQPVSSFLQNTNHMFRADSPLFLAQQICQSRSILSHKVDASTLALRLDGLRFLANATNFKSFFKYTANILKFKYAQLPKVEDIGLRHQDIEAVNNNESEFQG